MATWRWAVNAWVRALLHAADWEVDVELGAVVVVVVGAVVVGDVGAVVVVVVGAVVVVVVVVVEPGAAVAHAVPARDKADAADAESVSAVFWALTTACCAWLSLLPAAPPPVEATAVVVVVGGDAGAVVDGDADVVVFGEDVVVVEVLVLDDWADSSSASLAWAEERAKAADVTAFCSGVGSSVANVWPAVTVWLRATSTAETVPATWKFAVA